MVVGRGRGATQEAGEASLQRENKWDDGIRGYYSSFCSMSEVGLLEVRKLLMLRFN